MICEGPTADELCSVGWCIYVFNPDFTHLCLDIAVPAINKDIIIIIITSRPPAEWVLWFESACCCEEEEVFIQP